MKKFFWLPLLMALVLTGCSNSKIDSSANPQKDEPVTKIDSSQAIFFWGDGCPHCENVEKYFADNDKLDEKLGIQKMEVFKNKGNQDLFMDITKKCGIGGGVPVLYKDGKCTVGDTPIIEELKKIK